MDALISTGDKADRKRRGRQTSSKSSKDDPLATANAAEKILRSINLQTTLPKHLSKLKSASSESFKFDKNNNFTPFAFQRNLSAQTRWREEAKEAAQDAEILKTMEGGELVAEGEFERTWKVTQRDIIDSVGSEQAKLRSELKLDGGSYRLRYTRNGRHVAIAGKQGHIASFDWQTGKIHCELQVRETCRDISFLNDHSHFAVAQKLHVYIYDQQGIELHRLREHIDITRLDYLPYHWLLVTVGNPGILRYHDTSIGNIVATHRTKLGACRAMAQNPHNAVIYLGHQNGTVTLWTPNLSEPAVRLLAHLGSITSVSIDPSTSGRYLASAGVDGKVKVWDCRNWKGCVREWDQRGTGSIELEWSQKGFLSVLSGGNANVYAPSVVANSYQGSPPMYLTHPIPQRPLTSTRFCPFTDMLTIGHTRGLSSIIVPGAGEPTFDTAELDPFESKKKRGEREVHNLLDKIQPDLIALDPDMASALIEPEPEPEDEYAETQRIPMYKLPRQQKLKRAGIEGPSQPAPPQEGYVHVRVGPPPNEDAEAGYSESDASESDYDEDKLVGHGGASTQPKKNLKTYQKKVGKNVMDPTVARLKAKIAERRHKIKQVRLQAGPRNFGGIPRKSSALDRFRREARV